MVRRPSSVSRENKNEGVNYLEVAWFLYKVNYWVFRNVRRGDMTKIRNMSSMLKDVVSKQKKSRDILANSRKKQEKSRNKAQIKPSEQKLGGV
jgi:hypothetical protein